MNYKVKRYFKRLDPSFKGVFKNKQDPYAFLASKMFNVDYKECNPFEHYDGKKYAQCKWPTAKGQLYRQFAKLFVMTAVYPGFKDLNCVIKDAQRIIVLNKE